MGGLRGYGKTGRSRRNKKLLLSTQSEKTYPKQVSDLGYNVWDWDASNISTLYQDSAKTTPVASNSDPVGAWVDGVQGVDAIQATTANKPTYTTNSLNGLPTLAFNGDLLETASISISTFAVWCVFSYTSKAMTFEHSTNTTINDGMYYYLSEFRVRRASASTSAFASVTPEIFRGEFDGVSRQYVNNTLGGTGASIATSTATAPLFIGARSGVSLPMTGNIAHLCIVSPYPTPAIIAQMESYINSKWGIYTPPEQTPMDIASEKGYYVVNWDASDTNTLYQDSAKTTKVTADSQPVGAWVDTINGVDALQSTTANKPTYKTSTLNGLSTLSFNGDVLSTGNISISTFAVWVVFKSVVENINTIYEQSIQSLNNDGMALFGTGGAPVATIRVRRTIDDTKSLTLNWANDDTWRIVRHAHNGTNASHTLTINDAVKTLSDITINDVGTGIATASFFIGSRSGALIPLTGNIAHLCIVTPYPDAQTIADIEEHLRAKWLVYSDDAIEQAYIDGHDVWHWDASDASTLFQDSSASIPVTSDAQPVGAWKDKIQGVNAIQSTTSNKPTYAQNTLDGKSTLSFDGSDMLATANITISTFAVWAVFRSSNTVNTIAIEQSANPNSNDGFHLSTSSNFTLIVRRGVLQNNKNMPVDWANDNTWRVVRHAHNGTNATHTLAINDVLQSLSSTASSDDVGTATATRPLFIGARSGVVAPLTGNIAELVIVTPYPDTTTIARIEAQLNEKWSIY